MTITTLLIASLATASFQDSLDGGPRAVPLVVRMGEVCYNMGHENMHCIEGGDDGGAWRRGRGFCRG